MRSVNKVINVSMASLLLLYNLNFSVLASELYGSEPDLLLDNNQGTNPDVDTDNSQGTNPDVDTDNSQGTNPDVDTDNSQGTNPDGSVGDQETDSGVNLNVKQPPSLTYWNYMEENGNIILTSYKQNSPLDVVIPQYFDTHPGQQVYLNVGDSFTPNTSSIFPNTITSVTADENVKLKGTSLSGLFKDKSELHTVELSLDLKTITDFSEMFKNAKKLTTLDVSKWNVSGALTLNSMFSGAIALQALDVSQWDTQNVTDFTSMFDSITLNTLDVSKWNVSKGQKFVSMFNKAGNLTTLDVRKWNVSSANDISNMFSGASALQALDVSQWDTENVITMLGVFNGAGALKTLDLSNWNTQNVTTMSNMFQNTTSLIQITMGPGWKTSKVEKMISMFNGASALTTLDLSSWDVSNVKQMTQMFNGASSLTTLNVNNWDVSNVTNMANMFKGINSLGELDLSSWKFNTNPSVTGFIENTQNPMYIKLPQNVVSGHKVYNQIETQINTSKILTFNVALDVGGGTWTGAQPVDKYFSKSIIYTDADKLLSDPTNDVNVPTGKVLEGWYEDQTHTTKWNFNNPVSKSMTLYAKIIDISTNNPLDYITIPAHIDLTDDNGKVSENGVDKSSEYAGQSVTIEFNSTTAQPNTSVNVSIKDGIELINNQVNDTYTVGIYNESGEKYSATAGVIELGELNDTNQDITIWLNTKKDKQKEKAIYKGNSTFIIKTK